MKQLFYAILLTATSASAVTITGVTFREYSNEGSTVTAITSDKVGEVLYFTDQNFSRVGSINLQTGEIKTTSARPTTGETVFILGGTQALTFGADGNLYYPAVFGFGTPTAVSAVGRFNPSSGMLTYLTVPDASAFSSALGQITAGSDGKIYFTEPVNAKIGVISQAGAISEMAVATASGGRPGTIKGIAYGANNQIWVTAGFRSLYAVPSGGGTATEYKVDGGGFRGPTGITRGFGSEMFFTLSGTDADGGNKIGRIAEGGSITLWDAPTANSAPTGIAAGSDHKIYVTAPSSKQLIQLNPNTGAVAASAIPNGQTPIAIDAVPARSGSSNTELIFYSLPANLRDGMAQKATISETQTPSQRPDLTFLQARLEGGENVEQKFRAGQMIDVEITVSNRGDGPTDGSEIVVTIDLERNVFFKRYGFVDGAGTCDDSINGTGGSKIECRTSRIVSGKGSFAISVLMSARPDFEVGLEDDGTFHGGGVTTVRGGGDTTPENGGFGFDFLPDRGKAYKPVTSYPIRDFLPP